MIRNQEPEKWLLNKTSACGPTEFMPRVSLNPKWVRWSEVQKQVVQKYRAELARSLGIPRDLTGPDRQSNYDQKS